MVFIAISRGLQPSQVLGFTSPRKRKRLTRSFYLTELAVEICFSPMESLVEQSKQQSSAALQHVNTGFLPRGRNLKLLVNEFSHYKTWIFKTNQSNNQVEDVMSSFPKGTRVVHRKLLQCPKSRSLYRNFTHKYSIRPPRF